MQGRSWMAALTLAAGVALIVLGASGAARAGDAAIVNKVTLSLKITGLGREGCEVEVKPGHAACDFPAVTKKVAYSGGNRSELNLASMQVTSTSPDRDCLFSITIKEPGQAPRTVRRGIRLVAPTPEKALPEQTFQCYLRSPALTAKDDATRRVR